jgi:hypothetical protein
MENFLEKYLHMNGKNRHLNKAAKDYFREECEGEPVSLWLPDAKVTQAPMPRTSRHELKSVSIVGEVQSNRLAQEPQIQHQ